MIVIAEQNRALHKRIQDVLGENARLKKERDEAVEVIMRMMDAEGLEAEDVMEDMADFLTRLEVSDADKD